MLSEKKKLGPTFLTVKVICKSIRAKEWRTLDYSHSCENSKTVAGEDNKKINKWSLLLKVKVNLLKKFTNSPEIFYALMENLEKLVLYYIIWSIRKSRFRCTISMIIAIYFRISVVSFIIIIFLINVSVWHTFLRN